MESAMGRYSAYGGGGGCGVEWREVDCDWLVRSLDSANINLRGRPSSLSFPSVLITGTLYCGLKVQSPMLRDPIMCRRAPTSAP